ncbi:hypothetical protein B7494_g8147 [Chlorociboria aeruginascens]|nr:hypothetical protein B7494_g8147 [Chlorociboria aeruginascens]
MYQPSCHYLAIYHDPSIHDLDLITIGNGNPATWTWDADAKACPKGKKTVTPPNAENATSQHPRSVNWLKDDFMLCKVMNKARIMEFLFPSEDINKNEIPVLARRFLDCHWEPLAPSIEQPLNHHRSTNHHHRSTNHSNYLDQSLNYLDHSLNHHIYYKDASTNFHTYRYYLRISHLSHYLPHDFSNTSPHLSLIFTGTSACQHRTNPFASEPDAKEVNRCGLLSDDELRAEIFNDNGHLEDDEEEDEDEIREWIRRKVREGGKEMKMSSGSCMWWEFAPNFMKEKTLAEEDNVE